MHLSILLTLLAAPAGAADETGAIEGTVQLNAKGGSPAMWAWIDSEDGPLPEVPDVRQMRQIGTQFKPNLLVVPRGSIVEFPNDGPDQHNVHWVTPQYSDNLGTYRKGESEQRAFDVPGIYPIGCHRHRWMSANVVVVPSTWYAEVVGGQFRIDDLPPGRHRLVVWSQDGTELRANVEVEAGGTAPFSATLSAGR